jgi:hypothetical protein
VRGRFAPGIESLFALEREFRGPEKRLPSGICLHQLGKSCHRLLKQCCLSSLGHAGSAIEEYVEFPLPELSIKKVEIPPS